MMLANKRTFWLPAWMSFIIHLIFNLEGIGKIEGWRLRHPIRHSVTTKPPVQIMSQFGGVHSRALLLIPYYPHHLLKTS